MARRICTTFACLAAAILLLCLRLIELISWHHVLYGALMISLFYLFSNMAARSNSSRRHGSMIGDKHIVLSLFLIVLLLCLIGFLHYGLLPNDVQLFSRGIKADRQSGESYKSTLPRSSSVESDLVSNEWQTMLERVRVAAKEDSPVEADLLRENEQEDAGGSNKLVSKLLATVESEHLSNEEPSVPQTTSSSTTQLDLFDQFSSTYVGETSTETVLPNIPLERDNFMKKFIRPTPPALIVKAADSDEEKSKKHSDAAAEDRASENDVADKEDEHKSKKHSDAAVDDRASKSDALSEQEQEETKTKKADNEPESEKADYAKALKARIKKLQEMDSLPSLDELRAIRQAIDAHANEIEQNELHEQRMELKKLLFIKMKKLQELKQQMEVNLDRQYDLEKLQEELERNKTRELVAQLSGTLSMLEVYDWYWGVLPRNEVEMLLTEDGQFAVRLSKASIVISVLFSGKYHHFKLERLPGDPGEMTSTQESDSDVTSDASEASVSEEEKPIVNPRWTVGDRMYSFNDVPALVKYFLESGNPLSEESNVSLIHPAPRPKWFVSNDEVKVGQFLGKGFFGSVYSGEFNGSRVAVKTVREDLDEVLRNQFVREGLVLTNYHSPSVVRLVGIAALRHPILMMMELVNGTSLDKYVRLAAKARKPVGVLQKIEILRQVAITMAYLADVHETIHRDLSARNVILTVNGGIKLADFGLARLPPHRDVSLGSARLPAPPPRNVSANSTKKFVFIYHQQDGERVPWAWTAPESLRTKAFTTFSDVWSFGILAWEVFSDGMRPYADLRSKDLLTNLTQGYRLSPTKGTPREVYYLMRRCWRTSPADRPTFAEIATELGDIIRSSMMAAKLAEEVKPLRGIQKARPKATPEKADLKTKQVADTPTNQIESNDEAKATVASNTANYDEAKYEYPDTADPEEDTDKSGDSIFVTIDKLSRGHLPSNPVSTKISKYQVSNFAHTDNKKNSLAENNAPETLKPSTSSSDNDHAPRSTLK